MNYTAIILAAGQGKRTGLKENKILTLIHQKRVVDYSLDFFKNDIDCKEIILVTNTYDYEMFVKENISKLSQLVIGGKTRQESVRNSLQFVNEKYVLIHDAARPFIPKKSVEEIKLNLKQNSSITLGVKVTDTIQKIDDGFITDTLDRKNLIATQTPQAFHTEKIIYAHQLAFEQGLEATDDTTLVLKLLQIPAFYVEGDKKNIKLTNIDDLSFLEVIL